MIIKVEGWFVQTLDPKKPKDTGEGNKGTFEFPEYPIKYILHEPKPDPKAKDKKNYMATIFFHEEEATYPTAFRVTNFIGRSF